MSGVANVPTQVVYPYIYRCIFEIELNIENLLDERARELFNKNSSCVYMGREFHIG